MDKKKGILSSFLHSETAPSLVLLGVTVLTLLLVNFGFHDAYQHLLHWTPKIHLGPIHLELSLHHWINDGLMAIFFFTVGLEIKREIIGGELSSMKKASLPVIGAIGGIIMPILVFMLLNKNPEADAGWAIPMATDIAFSLGIIRLLGKRVPVSLLIFLTAFAIADDLGAILVIAIFYSSHIQIYYILAALAIVGFLMLLTKMGKYNHYLYIAIACVVWYLLLESGVHATIAGVLMSFTIPLKDASGHVEKSALNYHSPAEMLEHHLHLPVGFLVMPIFAFANAGVLIGAESFANFDLSTSIAAGLVIGKLVGISLLCWVAIKIGWADLPAKSNFKQLMAVALLGGVGFTMSLFISELAFDANTQTHLIDASKIGILLGSLIAGMGGYFMLRATTKPVKA